MKDDQIDRIDLEVDLSKFQLPAETLDEAMVDMQERMENILEAARKVTECSEHGIQRVNPDGDELAFCPLCRREDND